MTEREKVCGQILGLDQTCAGPLPCPIHDERTGIFEERKVSVNETAFMMKDCGHKKMPLILPCSDCFESLQALLRAKDREREGIQSKLDSLNDKNYGLRLENSELREEVVTLKRIKESLENTIEQIQDEKL